MNRDQRAALAAYWNKRTPPDVWDEARTRLLLDGIDPNQHRPTRRAK